MSNGAWKILEKQLAQVRERILRLETELENLKEDEKDYEHALDKLRD